MVDFNTDVIEIPIRYWKICNETFYKEKLKTNVF